MIVRAIAFIVTVILATFYTIYFTSHPTDAETQQSASVLPVKTRFSTTIKPILDNRCVVCHACYDAPCQLKLGSYEGIARGASKARVYDGKRLLEANMTRLFEDAHSIDEWREKDFFPVIAEHASTAENNVNGSLIAQFLDLKQQHPLSQKRLLPKDFKLDINRQHNCATNNDFDDFAEDNPLWGMPYGLPKLTKEHHETLKDWIAQGAKGDDHSPLTPEIEQRIERWEAFLNQDTLKAQLVSRYLYEHLFLVNLHFSDVSPLQYFRLFRSSTPPGQKAKGIFTRRPFDAPGVKRVYYRIEPIKHTVVHKAHMPYELSPTRMAFWQTLFFESPYQVTKLPSYEPETASNPFITFAEIPVTSRYKFLLDEAQNTIMQFIKGPVCRGQMALNVINDFFWVVFLDPDIELIENNHQFVQQALFNMKLPAEEESTALPTAWMTYAAMEKEYLKTKSDFIRQHVNKQVDFDADLIWDGDGINQNAGLTVFRHNTAASVAKGLIGTHPQTAWVLSYPLFERIHYLLVAGYDVFGNVGHQLNSRMYMDFLRMEGEFNFLSFLPLETQQQVRKHWYRGSVSEVEEFVYQGNQANVKTNIQYSSDNPLNEFYGILQKHLANTFNQVQDVQPSNFANASHRALSKINQVAGKGASLMSESTIVQIITNQGESRFYTLLRHSAYTNISHLFNEEDRRLPEEDRLTITQGFATSHPNTFMRVMEKDLTDFSTEISQLKDEQSYTNLMDKFGVRRTAQDFWAYADEMHLYFSKTYPLDFGLLDFNRLENR